MNTNNTEQKQEVRLETDNNLNTIHGTENQSENLTDNQNEQKAIDETITINNYMEYAEQENTAPATSDNEDNSDNTENPSLDGNAPDSANSTIQYKKLSFSDTEENQEQNFAQSIAETPAEPLGFAEKCFGLLAKIGLPVLVLLTLALCGQQYFFLRDFWFSEEVRYADIYMNLLSSQNFFTLSLNGHPYAETGPLYFVLIWLIDLIPTVDMPQAFFVSSILFSALFVASTWILARGLDYSNKIAFASGLIVLSTFFLAGFTHHTSMDLLFATFLNLGYMCFFRAWKKQFAPIWLVFAFLFLCLASLTSTLLVFVLPFVASFIFFIWTGKYKRINSADGVFGFFLALAIVFAWLGYIYLYGNAEYINTIFQDQFLNRFSPLHAHEQDPCWYYFALLPFMLFPYLFIILFANWGKWLKKSGFAFRARKTENATAWLLLLILTHMGIFSLFKDKNLTDLIPVLPFFAVLLAKSLVNLNGLRSKLFFGLLSLLSIVCGLFLIAFEFHAYILEYMPKLLPMEIPAFIEVACAKTQYGLACMGGIFILLGILLWKGVKRQFAGGSALVYALGIILVLQPFSYLLAPQLDSIFSTKNHAYAMADAHTKNNAVPASYKIYPDIFTYYYNEALNKDTYQQKTVAQLQTAEELTDFLLSNDNVVLAISQQDFEALPYKDKATVLDYKQWIENQYAILALWNISTQEPAGKPEVPNEETPNAELANTQNTGTEMTNQEANPAELTKPDAAEEKNADPVPAPSPVEPTPTAEPNPAPVMESAPAPQANPAPLAPAETGQTMQEKQPIAEETAQQVM